MNDLSVSTDYTRYHDTCESYPYVVERAVNSVVEQSSWILLPLTVGAVLVLASYTRCCSMFHERHCYFEVSAYNSCYSRLGRAKSHIIFCDTDLNTIPGVYLNAYQNFLVIAMRMHHYLRSWGANIRKNLKFIHSMSWLFLPTAPES
jgi:hypothetical protein